MSFVATLRSSGMTSLHSWLPTRRQLKAAVRLDLGAAIDGDELLQHDLDGAPATTMQQALGLVFLCGLEAGLLPTLVSWFLATRAGTSTVLLGVADRLEMVSAPALPLSLQGMLDTTQTAASASPIFPGWLAALLSALGGWVNWPLNFLTVWIVYGLVALGLALLFGATTTMQRFYAATGYAAIPLILLGLGVIPWIGPLFVFAGLILAVIVFYRALRHVTELPRLRSLLSALLPPAIAFLLSMLIIVSFSLSAARLFL